MVPNIRDNIKLHLHIWREIQEIAADKELKLRGCCNMIINGKCFFIVSIIEDVEGYEFIDFRILVNLSWHCSKGVFSGV